MTTLLDETIPRTIDRIVRDWTRPELSGARLDAWLFEDVEARRQAEAALAAAGVEARIRSAYKPLVHAFLEEIDTAHAERVEVVYPVHPRADASRFLLEAYPLAALLQGVDLVFVPGGAELAYHVTVETAAGQRTPYRIEAPNRLHRNHLGETNLSPTGWLRVTNRPGGLRDLEERVGTDAEAAFARVMGAVAAHDWPAEEPYCETLDISVTIAGIERPLAYGDEVMSTREALHEDLYFSLLEWFRQRAGRGADDRGMRPGQIVPDVRAGHGETRVRVALRRFGTPADSVRPLQDLASAESALGLAQIHHELDALAGERLEARSREGRPVRGLYREGRRPAILVTAGQHANETSGPVGALRAAGRLLADPDASVALIPVENPDGYALHGRLCEGNPRHMHHAARYTSLGSDVDYGADDELYEIEARRRAIALSGAQLHVNLHGYPAHEWTRPFTGYLPRGFELWTLPKGFLLILRHHPGWGEQGRALLAATTERLSGVPGLEAFNRRQMEVCRAHGCHVPGELFNGIPCLIAEDTRHPVPLTLITEFPDETIYGAAFRFAHEVQMTTVLAAEEAFAAMMSPSV